MIRSESVCLARNINKRRAYSLKHFNRNFELKKFHYFCVNETFVLVSGLKNASFWHGVVLVKSCT